MIESINKKLSSLTKNPKQYETSYSEFTLNNLIYGITLIPPENSVLVATGALYFSPKIKEIYNEVYEGDIDIVIPRKYLEENKDLENFLFSENFVKGAVKEEIAKRGKKRRRVLPNSYVFMKDQKGTRLVDYLLGFHVSSPFFYKPIEDERDIREISEKVKLGDYKLNLLKDNYILAEKIMLPEEKREKSFDKAFNLIVSQSLSPPSLAEEVAPVILDYARDEKKLNKWWKELKKYNYAYGAPNTRANKERFFNSLKNKLNI